MREAGGDVIGLDWRVNLDEAWARLGDVAVMGNFDSVALFANQDFIRAQGISDAERDAWVPSEATAELIHYRLRNCRSDATYHIGAAAVMIASEGQSLETRAGEARHTLLAKTYGLTEQDTLFFSVHQKEDVGHVAEGIQLVSELCTTAQMQQGVALENHGRLHICINPQVKFDDHGWHLLSESPRFRDLKALFPDLSSSDNRILASAVYLADTPKAPIKSRKQGRMPSTSPI